MRQQIAPLMYPDAIPHINTRFVLDELLGLTKAAAAYSLRKMRWFIPYAIRVRRDSDNAEKDIGFVGENLDIVSLLVFVGSGSGYVSKWYDQSGNGNDATQSTAANQPRIVNAGVVDVDAAGRPTCVFDGTNDVLLVAKNSTINNLVAMTASVVFTNSGAGGSGFGRIFDKAQKYYFNGNNAANRVANIGYGQNFSGSSPEWYTPNSSFPDSQAGVVTVVYNSTSTANDPSTYINGTAQSLTETAVPSGTYSDDSGSDLYIGNRAAGDRALNGKMSELIITNTALTDSQRQEIERNQGKYYGITVA